MDREPRREYLESLLGQISAQRKVDLDQALMELIHFAIELDDEVTQLNAQVAELEERR